MPKRKIKRQARKFLSTGQVSKKLGVTAQTIRAMAESKQIGHYRFGRTFKFTAADVKEFLSHAHVGRKVG